MMSYFEWDESKNRINIEKHGVDFTLAKLAFADPKRNSGVEKRYFCLGLVEGKILTVRFTRRASKIRIIGAAYWRKGKKEYEEKNQQKH